jgi:hypothetical protein
LKCFILWVVPKTPFFVKRNLRLWKRRWNCLDNSPLVKGDVTLFYRRKLRNCHFFQGCSIVLFSRRTFFLLILEGFWNSPYFRTFVTETIQLPLRSVLRNRDCFIFQSRISITSPQHLPEKSDTENSIFNFLARFHG